MTDFVNTIDVIGDDAVIDSIINRTITEFKDDTIKAVGRRAFMGCKALKSVRLPNVESIYDEAFKQCSSLTGHLDLPNVTYLGLNSFRESGLTSVKLYSLTELGSSNDEKYIFYGCPKLEYADFWCLTKIGGDTQFGLCTALKTLVLRATSQVCTTNKDHIKDCKFAKGEGYIYVPKTLVDSYRSATNWSAYADCFRALEDYTVDGTTTGELDEFKI